MRQLGCTDGTCSPRAYPNRPPNVVAIPDAYQPKDTAGNPTGVVLEWRVFAAAPAPPSGKGPGILFLHEGGFYTGNVYSVSNEPVLIDMASRGYYVYVAAYRLAPCGLIKGQLCHNDLSSGRPPQQTDDVKAFIKAARNDSHSNGKLAVIGGSAGASHAAFAALDTSTSTGWPNWSASDRADVTACLSGAYDFGDRTPENYRPDPVDQFQFLIENYTNTCYVDPQRALSPIGKIGSSTASNFKPMYFINSEHDTMPFHQIIDIQSALVGAGVNTSNYQIVTIPDSKEHAFDYWLTWDGGPDPDRNWGDHVMDFVGPYLQ